ncbi:methylated-DNA--[protein]-cysteine S-methyltransferase [Heyndrickxia ginsengihumi]|uniref:Methylated-DNA--protein-cysteine methyltransferase n=1 Tax=Heyndrickxia ginsengihumi TaxID=363870 RepID=A0A0A6VBB7_9BACI|nr:methylated-DNA--[protein]-cysteine S-methyltransferase [Heyndrickxia ginsengihumi]KHD84866.1 cysteine methyltransferase [Heyndrickxia ginsengihumi]MBE6183595.1 methylated-DNA--[protein]-cysteine S-methyltransferase [Bacillus sp. (in: firmicutes)]MCM3024952.1 methylated-DNA--[protein]-cysteine S-methyltransferase [Heyndrickxia ginsengihumi]NEY18738.1 methylated-DNA--[protein]-cysteine S-methyltransferase [Heyndrickxia ginsengihumi]
MAYITMESPIGLLTIVGNSQGITAIHFGQIDLNEQYEPGHPVLQKAVQQLQEYFLKRRKTFDVPIIIEGTPFQKAVWKELQNIPYGETRSYSDIAEAIDREKAVRAIGQANKKNRIPIIIPCHRVIGKNHSLTGYAGNQVDKKATLLEIEGFK